MAALYKTIKRWRGMEYILVQNKTNSRYCYVESWHRGTGEQAADIAELDNKTKAIKWLVPASSLPKEVREVIELYANE